MNFRDTYLNIKNDYELTLVGFSDQISIFSFSLVLINRADIEGRTGGKCNAGKDGEI